MHLSEAMNEDLKRQSDHYAKEEIAITTNRIIENIMGWNVGPSASQ